MPRIFHYPHRVAAAEIDEQGHVNNLAYLKWMIRAAVHHSSAQGWPPERYHDLGAGWVVRSHFVEYLQPAFEDDDVVVQTWVANFRKIRSLRKYKVRRKTDDVVLAVGETDWAFIALEQRVPRRIPQELAESFELVTEEEAP